MKRNNGRKGSAASWTILHSKSVVSILHGLHIAVFYISYHVSLMKIPYLIVEWLLCYLLLKHFKNVSHLNYLNTFIKDLKIKLSNNHRKDVLL